MDFVLASIEFHLSYALPVLLGLALFVFYPVTRGVTDRRGYYRMQAITFVGAIVGAKLAVIIGDLNWPRVPLHDWSVLLDSGRSIVGALIGGFVAAEAAKPLLRYRMPPNDRFAALLPFSIGIGRVGCLLTGCCRGLHYDGPCAITYADGIPRYPAQALEVVFQLCVGALFILMVKRRVLFGRMFALYMVVYGVFRFVTEFIRETPKTFGPLSGYQIMTLVMVILGGAFLIKRTVAPPSGWTVSSNPAEESR